MVQPLPDYEDPIAKRPLKAGEVGCFLSHYRVWQDVVNEKLKRVIVFEDDLRFAMDGMERVREVLQDLDASKKDWDLIYLGRKKMDQDEVNFPGKREKKDLGSVGTPTQASEFCWLFLLDFRVHVESIRSSEAS